MAVLTLGASAEVAEVVAGVAAGVVVVAAGAGVVGAAGVEAALGAGASAAGRRALLVKAKVSSKKDDFLNRVGQGEFMGGE